MSLFVLTALVPAAATAADPRLVVSGGETARAATLKPATGPQVADVTLIVRNGSQRDGVLSIRFVTDDGAAADVGPTVAAVSPPSSTNPKPLRVRLLRPSSLEIEAHDAIQLTVRFTRAPKPAGVSGSLIMSLGETTGDGGAASAIAGPVVVPVTLSNATPTQLKFAQEKASLAVTRLLGPVGRFFAGCGACVWGESIQVETRGNTTTEASTRIHSATGGVATLDLMHTESRQDPTTSKVTVTRIDHHGSYEGKLTIDPDEEKPRSLTISVKAQDFILWPLLVLLCGTGLGVVLLRRDVGSRNRELARGLIKESVQPYIDARAAAAGARADRFYLNGLLPSAGDGYFPNKKGCEGLNQAELQPMVPRLYCDIAGVSGGDALEGLLVRVTTLNARFDRWSMVEGELVALRAAIAAFPEDDGRYEPMRQDAHLLEVRGTIEPDDDKEASEFALVLREEASAAAAYATARRLYDAQAADWKNARTKVDPDKDLGLYEPPPTRTSVNAELVTLALRYKVDLLRRPDLILPDADAEQVAEAENRRFDEFIERNISYARAPGRGILVEAGSPPSLIDTRTPEQIRADVRRADWVVFGLTAALTGLVYVSAKYSADWGSFTDYLVAFAAGAVVPTAVTWTLVPYSRSYKPKAAAPAAAASG